MTDADPFATLRHYYLRVSSQAQNRLTVSTFLAGLTFGAFAALLALGNVDISGSTDWVTYVFLVAAVLLGAATIALLLAAIGAYFVLQLAAQLAPSTVDALQNNKPQDIDLHDRQRLQQAYALYEEGGKLIVLGLFAMLAALPLVAFHVNVVMGIVLTLFLLLAGVVLRRLRQVLVGSARATAAGQESPLLR